MAETSEDKKQIGLTPSGAAAMAILMETDQFATEYDAYKVGIAYAISEGMSPADAPDGGYHTKFNAAGGLDHYGDVRDVIVILLPEATKRPYATAERLAELGVTALANRFQAHADMAEILGSTLAPDADSAADS